MLHSILKQGAGGGNRNIPLQAVALRGAGGRTLLVAESENRQGTQGPSGCSEGGQAVAAEGAEESPDYFETQHDGDLAQQGTSGSSQQQVVLRGPAVAVVVDTLSRMTADGACLYHVKGDAFVGGVHQRPPGVLRPPVLHQLDAVRVRVFAWMVDVGVSVVALQRVAAQMEGQEVEADVPANLASRTDLQQEADGRDAVE